MLNMFLCLFMLFQFCHGLWQNGVVHYNINVKDYDLHSQDEIISTLSKLQDEICLKFFLTQNNNISNDKILYISNPDKIKTCFPKQYNFSGNVVDLPIGYKCINEKDIARIVVDMVRASIENTVAPTSGYDRLKKIQEEDSSRSFLISAIDRNFINAHYYQECGLHSQNALYRRSNDDANNKLSEKNLKYYASRVWPLGIVLYGIDEDLRGTPDHRTLSYSMASIELSTCVVFQEIKNDDILSPKNLVWFGKRGQDMPNFGFNEGNQTLKLSSMISGAPGHTAHTLNNLMRILGVHMMSNRYDRDNYVTINWSRIERGKEHFLERAPEESWLSHIPYDFNSVTHAPANYMCNSCDLGETTVQPIRDYLWQVTRSMGHKTVITESDIQTINLLYNEQCRHRLGRTE